MHVVEMCNIYIDLINTRIRTAHDAGIIPSRGHWLSCTPVWGGDWEGASVPLGGFAVPERRPGRQHA